MKQKFEQALDKAMQPIPADIADQVRQHVRIKALRADIELHDIRKATLADRLAPLKEAHQAEYLEQRRLNTGLPGRPRRTAAQDHMDRLKAEVEECADNAAMAIKLLPKVVQDIMAEYERADEIAGLVDEREAQLATAIADLRNVFPKAIAAFDEIVTTQSAIATRQDGLRDFYVGGDTFSTTAAGAIYELLKSTWKEVQGRIVAEEQKNIVEDTEVYS